MVEGMLDLDKWHDILSCAYDFWGTHVARNIEDVAAATRVWERLPDAFSDVLPEFGVSKFS